MSDKTNEIVAAAKDAKEREAAVADAAEPNAGQSWPLAAKIGVGVGVGSTALVAALLFANRSKKK